MTATDPRHVWPIRVYYEDVDLAGIVYYANYLKFIERARSAMRSAGLVFAVSRVEADYLRPARYDDTLQVETTMGDVTAARFVMKQTVMRDGRPLFRATVTIVCMDLSGRPRRLPAEITDLVP